MAGKYYQSSLVFSVKKRIEQLAGHVVLREDVADMASPRQISRCFQRLLEMGLLIKIGRGVYAKAYLSEYLNKPVIAGGFDQVCKEALTRLGIKWEPGEAEKAYNAGLSTQVPVKTIVQLKDRYRGQLSYGDKKLIVERGINAR